MKFSYVIAGLGNPGQKYQDTRHNCGFMFVTKLLQIANAQSVNSKKFNCLSWKAILPEIPGEWLLTEPQTFMNESGHAIQPLLAWYNIPASELIVVHDELDLPAGELRFKFGGGLAGHKGLASIAQQLGTQDFYRLRIGIGRPLRKTEVLDWVLTKPGGEELKKIRGAIDEGIETLRIFATEGSHDAVIYARNVKVE